MRSVIEQPRTCARQIRARLGPGRASNPTGPAIWKPPTRAATAAIDGGAQDLFARGRAGDNAEQEIKRSRRSGLSGRPLGRRPYPRAGAARRLGARVPDAGSRGLVYFDGPRRSPLSTADAVAARLIPDSSFGSRGATLGNGRLPRTARRTCPPLPALAPSTLLPARHRSPRAPAQIPMPSKTRAVSTTARGKEQDPRETVCRTRA